MAGTARSAGSRSDVLLVEMEVLLAKSESLGVASVQSGQSSVNGKSVTIAHWVGLVEVVRVKPPRFAR